MKQIQLSQGMVAVVDDDDFERLSGFRWFYRGERNENLGYAMRHGRKTDRTKTIYLHREIANPPPGHEVVFVNHDRLDCRKRNLLVLTKTEALKHHRTRSVNTTREAGVHRNAETGTWSAYICRSGQYYHVGTYPYKVQAEHFYQKAVAQENQNAALAERRMNGLQEIVCSASA